MGHPFPDHEWWCVQGPTAKRGDFLEGDSLLFPSPDVIGGSERDAAWSGGCSWTCAEELIAPLRALAQSARTESVFGRPCMRVLSAPPGRVLIVTDTVCFRRLAKGQVGLGDAVLEVGSSLGECTHILHCRASVAVGIDVAGDLVQESQRRYPECRFEWLDCFEEPQRLADLCRELAACGSLKLFVDVGGDRTTADVCRVLECLADSVETPPALIVIKARSLAASASQFGGGQLRDTAAWWLRAAEPGAEGSARQKKKKLARARKAKWEAASEEDWNSFRDYRAQWEVADEKSFAQLAAAAREQKAQDPELWGSCLRQRIRAAPHA